MCSETVGLSAGSKKGCEKVFEMWEIALAAAFFILLIAFYLLLQHI
jgi:hypothetical protein